MSRARRRFLPLLCLLTLFGAACARLQDAPAETPVAIVVSGVAEPASDNILAALALPRGMVVDGRVEQRWLQRFERQVPTLVDRALRPYGYYQSTAETRLVELEPGARYRLEVAVVPGPPLRVRSLKVRLDGPGLADRELQRLVAAFPLHQGEVLRQDLYEEAKGRLRARAESLGFLDAAFTTHVIRVDQDRAWADIELVLTTGPRYHFGPVLVHGNLDYPELFLRRYLTFRTGDRYSTNALGQTQLNYRNSERFQEVVITPRRELAREDRIPVSIELTPAPPRKLRLGAGYGTDTGARGSVRYQDLNSFSRGHEFYSDLVVAQREQTASLSYRLPGLANLDSFSLYRVGYEHLHPETYESFKYSLELQQTYGLSFETTATGFVQFFYEDYTVGGESSISRIVMPGLRFQRRRYNDPVRPRSGYQVSLEVRGTSELFGSDVTLGQGILSGSVLVPLPARSVLYLRTQAAGTLEQDPFSEVPVSLRFFAGGDQSVRGYAYESLGPMDENGDVVGGKHLLVGSAELEHRVGENWALAAFFDAGNAFDSLAELEFYKGAGLGYRYYTPVGPFRVDIARQLGVADPSYRLHLSIGFGW